MSVPEIQAYFNQILYPHKKFDKSNIHHLNKYMLSKSFIDKSFVVDSQPCDDSVQLPIPTCNPIMPLSLPVIKLEEPPAHVTIPVSMKDKEDVNDVVKTPVSQVPNMKMNGSVFYPQQENSLFWCLYIIHYGLQQYQLIRKHGNEEMVEKQKIIDFLKTPVGSAKLKVSNHRITHAMVQEIISDVMMMKKKSGLSAIFGVAAYYNIPSICIVKGKLLIAFTQDKNVPVTSLDSCAIIYASEKNSFGVDIEPSPEKIKKLDKYVKIESLDKPLKGISTYKVNDLDEIARKLSFSEDEIMKWTKPELYNNITEYMVKHKIGDF